MAEIRWTPQAADDLEAITNFISTDSPQYARLFGNGCAGGRRTSGGLPELRQGCAGTEGYGDSGDCLR